MEEKTSPQISAIVPCYNEAERIGRVLTVLLRSAIIGQVIVVNDGSTDNSLEVIQSYQHPKLTLVNLVENRGKGDAVKAGLRRARYPLIFLCDADLRGLKEAHLHLLLKEYQKAPGQQIVVGLKEKQGFFGTALGKLLRRRVLPLIAGERLIARSLLKKILAHKLASHYGLEIFMNYYCRKNKITIKKVELKKVNDLPKFRKAGYGWWLYLLEGLQIFKKYLQVYTWQLSRDLLEELKKSDKLSPLLAPPKPPAEAKYYQERKVKVGGIWLHWAQAGPKNKPSLVFVHGWANNWQGWLPLTELLRSKYRLYLIDLPGFGDSGQLPYYSIAQAASYLRLWLKKIKLQPLALVGLSMGSLVVAETVQQESLIAKTAILLGAVFKTRKKAPITLSLKTILTGVNGKETPEMLLKRLVETKMTAYLLAKYINMYRFNRFLIDTYGLIGKKKASKKAFVQMGLSIVAYSLRETIAKIKIPLLFIYGAQDKITPPQEAKRILQQVCQTPYQVVTVSRAGHIVSLEQPKRIARIIERFLRQHTRSHSRKRKKKG